MLLAYLRARGMDPTIPMAQLEVLHRERCERMLTVGIRLRKIRKWNWDDPIRSRLDFEECFHVAVENLKKRRKTVPPRGLAKFSRKHVSSPTQGDRNADRT